MQVEEASPDSDELSWTTIAVLFLLGAPSNSAVPRYQSRNISLGIDSIIPAGATVVGALIKFLIDLIRELGPREQYNGPEITFAQKGSDTKGKTKKTTTAPDNPPVT